MLFKDPDVIARLPHLTNATIAGIVVAVSGNVLISLALNCQKLAHKRLERARETADRRLEWNAGQEGSATSEADDSQATSFTEGGADVSNRAVALIETEPLLSTSNGTPSPAYGTSVTLRPTKKPTIFSRLSRISRHDTHPMKDTDQSHLAALDPVDVVPILSPGDGRTKNSSTEERGNSSNNGNESDYLKSKLWWVGFLLMNVGEMGNFISYAFAPASVVAPLGTFALIANCLFAPLMLKERFRKRDFFGIVIAVIGAITVVLSTNPSDVRLDPQGLIEAIKQRPFIVYSIVYITGIIILSGLSEGSIGRSYVYVDVGLCALFGGFTVLSTKAMSTLITLEWFEIFAEWVTYPVLAVLLCTGVGQIKYLNRALMRFDSKVVVPTQFVMFTLSAIVGSAILYGDFKKATFHELVTFFYGCCATFAGVFIITWAPTPIVEESTEPSLSQDDEEARSDYLDPPDGDNPALRIVRAGSLGRRNPVKLHADQITPILRNRQSFVSLYGLSPAQRVLIINTPPRDEPVRPQSQDVERDPLSTPDSTGRRRAISWVGDDAHGHHAQGVRIAASPYDTRENSSRCHQEPAADRNVSRSPS
ncbi:magnesium transporter NIPA-domain-containing protein [Sparassis latifolia]